MAAMETLADLATTQTARCLGCGAVMRYDDGGVARWSPHGTCRSYYGAGTRVDYGSWLALVENDDYGDRAYFTTWASAEPMRGVPSWFDYSDLLEVAR